MNNFWRDPLQAALARTRRAWGGKAPPDRGAPLDRTFPEHVIHACLAWVNRLRLEQRGERRVRRVRRLIRSCADRWPRAAKRLRGTQQTRSEQGDAVQLHEENSEEEGRRLWIASGFSAAAIFAFLAIEYGFAKSALDLFLADPEQGVLGFKIENVGAVAIALAMAAAAEIAARSIRAFLAALPRWGRRLLVIAGALLLPVAFVLPFLSLRTEAAELGGKGAATALIPGLEAGANAASSGAGGDPTIPFLVLGLAPVLVGAGLRAATSSPHADEGLRLRIGYTRSRTLQRLREWRFARLVRKLDRAELKLASRVRAIARREAGDEAGRIVDRIGYRLVGDRWYGWLEQVPSVVETVVHSEPGKLPGGELSEVRERFEVAREELTAGGPVRRALEARFGNPLTPDTSWHLVDLPVIKRGTSNNHRERVDTEHS
jgi:hypothetical protein